MKYIIRFLKLTSRVKKLIFVSLFLSARYSWLIKNKPFKEISYILGRKDKEDLSYDESNFDIMCDIKKAVRMVCDHTPWESKCLVRAFVAKHLLKKCDISATIYLGVRKDGNGEMKAHAWTKCGEFFITGRRGSNLYTITSRFS